jgi:hypothetical protein
MNSEDEDMDDLERQLKEAEQTLDPAERQLWESVKKFIDAQLSSGVSRDRAYDRARNILRRASDIQARQRRASFKVIEPEM